MSRQEAFKELAPIAYKIAQSFERKLPAHVRADDLTNVALMGVWEAVTRRYSAGIQAMTALAVIRARGAVIDYLRTRDWATRHSRKKGNPTEMVYIEDYSQLSKLPDARDNNGFVITGLRQLVTPEDEAVANQTASLRSSALEDALASLSDRDRIVMRQLLNGVAQKDLAIKLNVSAPRISQIMHRCVPKIKAHVRRVLRGRKP